MAFSKRLFDTRRKLPLVIGTRGPEPGGTGTESLWRNRNFVRLWIGETASLFGTQISVIALPLVALLHFDVSAEAVGWLRFTQLAPYIVFALIFGVWTDRVRRRPLMLAANLTRMILLLAVPFLAYTKHLTFAILPVTAFAIGTAAVLFDVAWMSYVPHVVDGPPQYVEANAKLGVSASSAEVAGPGLAGWLIGLLTAPTTLIFDSFSYLVSLISLLLIRGQEDVPTPAKKERVWRDLVDGIRWITRNPILRPLALVGLACNFFMVLVSSMFIVYAVKELHFSPGLLGGIMSASGIGGLLGAIASRRLLRKFKLGSVYAISMIAIFLGPVLIPLAAAKVETRVVLFTLSFFVSYAGLGIAQVIVVSLRQATTSRLYMGRMNAGFRMVLFTGGALGGPAGGILVSAIGVRAALSLAAVASALIIIPTLLSPVSRLIRLPDEVDAAQAPTS